MKTGFDKQITAPVNISSLQIDVRVKSLPTSIALIKLYMRRNLWSLIIQYINLEKITIVKLNIKIWFPDVNCAIAFAVIWGWRFLYEIKLKFISYQIRLTR